MVCLFCFELFRHFRQRSGLQHIDYKHAMMGSQRPSTFGNDVRMAYSVLIGSIYKGVYTVVYILLNGVVDRTFAMRRAGSVIVYTQSSATINEVDIVSHLM